MVRYHRFVYKSWWYKLSRAFNNALFDTHDLVLSDDGNNFNGSSLTQVFNAKTMPAVHCRVFTGTPLNHNPEATESLDTLAQYIKDFFEKQRGVTLRSDVEIVEKDEFNVLNPITEDEVIYRPVDFHFEIAPTLNAYSEIAKELNIRVEV